MCCYICLLSPFRMRLRFVSKHDSRTLHRTHLGDQRPLHVELVLPTLRVKKSPDRQVTLTTVTVWVSYSICGAGSAELAASRIFQELIQARTHSTVVFHLHTELHTQQSGSFSQWKCYVRPVVPHLFTSLLLGSYTSFFFLYFACGFSVDMLTKLLDH